MNSMFKNALMITLVAATLMPVPAQATLQSDVSGIASTSLSDVINFWGDFAVFYANGIAKLLTTTPKDVYKFVSHPDTLAVAGVTAAAYAIYKYVNTPDSPVIAYRGSCCYCTRKLVAADVRYNGGNVCCSSCKDWWSDSQQLQQAFNETVAVLGETQTELAKLQVAMQELSDTTKVS